MNMLYDVIVLEPSTFFCVTVMYDVTLNPNPKSKNKEIDRNENINRKKNEKKTSLLSSTSDQTKNKELK